MKIHCALTILAIFSFAMESCSGKKVEGGSTLWQDIKFDMTYDEVKKIYPNSELIQVADDTKKDGLQFDGIVIQNENFFVQFTFENKKII
jgi:hypothetical protein